MFITVCCFSIGSYFLINKSVQTSLEQEANVAYELCDIVYYSLSNELDDLEQTKEYFYWLDPKSDESTYKNWISKTAESMSINNNSGTLSFCVIDGNSSVLFSSLKHDFDKKILPYLSETEKGYTLKKDNSGVYIQTLRPAMLLNNQCYIETLRDVTYIFENQQLQYEMFIRIILIVLVAVGAVTLFISKMLMKPVNSLMSATKEISTGNFSKKIEIKGEDEFADLSKNFNVMSCELEHKLNQLKQEAEKQELFVAAFSHELKTPLTSIIGYSDMLRSKKMNQDKISL